MANEAQQSQTAPSSSPSLIQRIQDWPRRRKLSLLVVGLLCVAVFTFLILQARVADYQLLYADMTQQEASSVVDWLQDSNVSYQLRDQGSSIYVPAGQVYKTRLDLAGDGLPQGQGVGFEIFDQQRFGVTQFTQQVNYQRALQGELARSVATLTSVQSARVHLVLPERQFLREQQEKAKASVVVEFAPGQGLDSNQIKGIIRLVSGSVEGMAANNVTVVDSQGNVLSGGEEEDSGSPISPEKLEYKQAVEGQYEQRAQALLDRVFGPNKALVRVTAAIDFVSKHTTEELYDPDSIVPRSEKTSESNSGTTAREETEGNAGGQRSSESTETVNYEISRTVNEITKTMGGVKNLSVAVLVGQQFLQNKGNGGAAEGHSVESLQRLVSSALGLQPDRGDSIEVVAMPVQEQAGLSSGTSANAGFSLYDYLPFVKYGLIALGFILAYFLLVRPVLQTFRSEVTEHYKTVDELEGEYREKVTDPTEQLRQEINHSEVTPAQIVKAWLKEN
ncbi:flagellar basal-body MS-ring/collar protein FliF [Desulfohalobium retbaense]|uniref:Flagellar M-ring protein n=1 Tax=Desulfohalobium retbaense (strain ATCC 49708 / DSM 5692 / JCM 16813 / HR100) TaxID=485915 RepID=C8WYV0_DESRD|nr:flagellar basal-body MS-ring/collar protein FliF [Desulfohalobium retbaense]ACV67866.1 flagellar M-ring protein FliF [Desulfohalobium retbaense DSM 5692]